MTDRDQQFEEMVEQLVREGHQRGSAEELASFRLFGGDVKGDVPDDE